MYLQWEHRQVIIIIKSKMIFVCFKKMKQRSVLKTYMTTMWWSWSGMTMIMIFINIIVWFLSNMIIESRTLMSFQILYFSAKDFICISVFQAQMVLWWLNNGWQGKHKNTFLRRGPLLRTLTGNHSASFVAKSAAVIETIHQEVLAEVGL